MRETAAARTTAGNRRRQRRAPGQAEEAVLEAAERLLGQRSLAQITTGELIEAAQVSRASFYFYFESKEAVLFTLVDRVVDQVYGASITWLERGDRPPEETLRDAMQRSVSVWRRHGAVLRAAVENWVVPELRDLWQDEMGRFIEAAAARIEQDRREGLAPDGIDPRALAAALVWMTERCLYFDSLAERGAPDELRDTLAAIWLRAVYCR